ncbi:MAG: HEAT repeat protein [Lentisphaerae bacterium ADurb.BinA184]|nr:MAG: HEAT repeat protein [Lentisphaerae bacterium ADurb.BinA184]
METLIPAILFTLLLPIWRERPITPVDLVPGPYPLHVEPADIVFAGQGFAYADDEVRTLFAQNLGKTQNSAAAAVLLEQLGREKEVRAVASLLKQLANLPQPPGASVESTILGFFGHESEAVRLWAAYFYGQLPDARAAELIALAHKDPSLPVRRHAVLAATAPAVQLKFVELDALRKADDTVLRSLAWGVSCCTGDAEEYAEPIVAACSDPDIGVRYALADHADALPGAVAVPVIERLAGDPHVSVRARIADKAAAVHGDNLLGITLALAVDTDYDVRRAATAALAAFPGQPAAEMLVQRFGDAHAFVRAEAEESAVRMHAAFPMADAAATRLADPDPNARLCVFNVLGRVQGLAHTRAVAAQLPKEERPENLAAALRALARLGYKESVPLILGYSDHAAAIVREGAAMAMGNLDDAAVDEVLLKRVRDESQPVRYAVIVSMGRLGKTVFSPTLLAILMSTGQSPEFTSDQRAAACWAAGRTVPLDRALADRLLAQATTPVVWTPMGMVFEPDYILASANWALCEAARRDARWRPYAENVIARHSREPTKEEMYMGGPGVLVPSAELRDAARQAQGFLDGKEVEARERPTRSMRLLYRPSRRVEEPAAATP